MSKRGRPALLDEQKKAEILAVLALGCNRRTAANYVNCHPKTIYNEALRDPNFAEQLSRREASAEIAHLGNINNAAKQSSYWRASAWCLERLYPDRYAARAPDTVTPQQLSDFIGRVAEIIVQDVPVDRYRKLVMAGIDQLLVAFESGGKRPPRGKNSRVKTDVFPRNPPALTCQTLEIPQNRLVKPEENNHQHAENA